CVKSYSSRENKGAPEDQVMDPESVVIETIKTYVENGQLKELIAFCDTKKKRDILASHEAALLAVSYANENNDVSMHQRIQLLVYLEERSINLIGVIRTVAPLKDIQGVEILAVAMTARYKDADKVFEFLLQ